MGIIILFKLIYGLFIVSVTCELTNMQSHDNYARVDRVVFDSRNESQYLW